MIDSRNSITFVTSPPAPALPAPPWRRQLAGDPLPWLLDRENPSVRYWALVDLLDRPSTDPEVQAARAEITRQPLVQELFARQQPAGHWGEDATKPYTAQGAVGVLSLLHLLGVPPDDRTAKGCDSLLTHCQHPCGGFSLTRTQRSAIFPCTTGEHLPCLVYFGFGDDRRVEAAFAFLVAEMGRDQAGANVLDCARYGHRPCLWGAIAALNGLAVLPPRLQSAQSAEAVERLAAALLDAPYDFAGEHRRWLTFGVPRGWDLLSALKALAAHGYSGDVRFAPLLALLLQQQDAGGCWLCGSASHTWPLEGRNRRSKWVTLDALRLLKRVASPARHACSVMDAGSAS